MKKLHLLIAMSLATAGAGCGHNSYSGQVAINLDVKSSDVSAGTITANKSITAEANNPYGLFLSNAQAKLGKVPSNVQISGLTLFLAATSQGVVALEQVFTGQVDMLFLMTGSGTSYSVGHFTNYTGPGPVNATVDFDPTKIIGQDHIDLMSGNFKVVLRGVAATGFATRGADANLQNTFTFEALE